MSTNIHYCLLTSVHVDTVYNRSMLIIVDYYELLQIIIDPV
jgi:hypothetical protein